MQSRPHSDGTGCNAHSPRPLPSPSQPHPTTNPKTMPLLPLQPPIAPLPPNLTFANKAALLTSPTRGITHATAHLLLTHHLSHLILTSRSLSTGLALQRSLQQAHPTAKLTLLAPFDLADPAQCAAALKRLVQDEGVTSLDILVLGAADGGTDYDILEATGRERLLQVNALTPAVVVAALLPLLRKSAHAPARAVLIGSRAAAHAGLFGGALPEGCAEEGARESEDEGDGAAKRTPLLDYLSTPTAMANLSRYPTTKALAALLIAELAERTSPTAGPRITPPNTILPLSICPGMVQTTLTDALPWYLRGVLSIAKAIAARTVEEGAQSVVLGLVMGEEGRGGLWRDGIVGGYVCVFSFLGFWFCVLGVVGLICWCLGRRSSLWFRSGGGR
ncbi:uncharacterized protein K452DRAFT_15527 [Aplosporella prunicola CBS 121167]|uniref:Ketoreductase (KR) domain-containing protein n=1 Tax=Aplosporella prunicola CBS 121167 TaxID=1176127 RepID=A0A6A6BHL7_9PEZI|nr:uncharacterized protein K452DRAFT_15527 [Aplosporella prunicola CBS 121167]KAF2143098.1 hypothetical protein K452DRAFT_15527 [Aplosporella prunicola CBS 121167]